MKDGGPEPVSADQRRLMGGGADAGVPQQGDEGSHPRPSSAPPDIFVSLKPLSMKAEVPTLAVPFCQERAASETVVFVDGEEVPDVKTIIGPRVPGLEQQGVVVSRTRGVVRGMVRWEKKEAGHGAG